MGRSIEYATLFLNAIGEMARRGLGARRGAFALKEIFLKGIFNERQEVYSCDRQTLALPLRIATTLSESVSARLAERESSDDNKSAPTLDQMIAETLSQLARPASQSVAREVDRSSTLKLRFVTPARIRVEGDLQTGLTFPLLVRNLLRRVSMLTAVHGRGRMQLDYRALIERAASARLLHSTFRWWDLARYTNRQETKLRVGGLIGDVEYEGDVIDDFMPLICAGEILGVGTGTSIGLGKYQIFSVE